MKNTRAIAGILFIFILGAVSGAFVTHMIHRAHLESFVSGGPQAREELLVKRLIKKLDLDSRQQEQVKAIVHESHTGIRQVRKQSRPQIEALLEQGQARINAILRPEQQEKFYEIIRERKSHRQPDGP